MSVGEASPDRNGTLAFFGNASLNELGQVVYVFELADGCDGVTLWTVPKPSSLVLLGAAGFGLLIRSVHSNRFD